MYLGQMCVLTKGKRQKYVSPHHMGSGMSGWMQRRREPVGVLGGWGCSRMVCGLVLKGGWCLAEVVPYVWQLVLTQVPVESGVLHTDQHGPGMTVDLFMYYVELVLVHWMYCSGAVVVYVGGGFDVFLDPFT